MSDDSNNDGPSFRSGVLNHQVRSIDISEEMQSSCIGYTMNVIVGRALPETRDSLKPVHRHTLYAMLDNGYRPGYGHVKPVKPVSDTMGNCHSHGDSAIYDTMVHMAQPWFMRYSFVGGQDNFGPRGGDGPAAMRYTEARLTPLTMEVVRDTRKNTINFRPNYDGRTTEPAILPLRAPQLLMNDPGGIAVGMATNTPSHSLREVADAINQYLDNSDMDKKTTLDTVMERIKGLDFPTAAQIIGNEGIRGTYTTSHGSIRMYDVISIEQEGIHQSVAIIELPHQVNPSRMTANIVDQVKDGRLQGTASIGDEFGLK